MSTIARAMAHIDSTADERDELRAALDVMTGERDNLLLEVDSLREELEAQRQRSRAVVDRLQAQLANADRETAEAVAFAVRTGQVLRAADPHGALIARYRFAATELAYFNEVEGQHPDSAWGPNNLRKEADRLEANP